MALSNRAINEIVVSSLLFTIASFVLAGRFMVRKVRGTKLDLSDWLTALSWFLLFALVLQLDLWAGTAGAGELIEDVSPTVIRNFFIRLTDSQYFYVNQITYFILSPVLKIAIVLFYRSVFQTPRFLLASSAVITLLTAWGVGIIVCGVFQCSPVKKFWEPEVEGYCVDLSAFLYGVQYPNIIFDFVLLLLPVPVIWNIRRPTRDKLALIGVFSLGGIGCVSGIVRVIMLGKLDPLDITYTAYMPAIWTCVEPCIAAICGSLPIIHGDLRRRKKMMINNKASNINMNTKPKQVASSFSSSSFPSGKSSKSKSDGSEKREVKRVQAVGGRRASKCLEGLEDLQGLEYHQMFPYNVLVSKEISILPESPEGSLAAVNTAELPLTVFDDDAVYDDDDDDDNTEGGEEGDEEAVGDHHV